METTDEVTPPGSVNGRRVFWTALLVYGLFVWPLASDNPLRYLALARALVEQGTLRLDAVATETGDLALHDGHTYLVAAPGPAFVAAPAYWLGACVGGPQVGFVLLTLLLGPVCGAIAALGFYRLTAFAFATALPERERLGWTLVYALCTFVFPLCTVGYHHALAWAVALWAAAFAFAHVREGGSRSALLCGLLAGALPACDYTGALISAWVGCALVCGGCRPLSARATSAGWFGVGCVAPIALLAAYHTTCFGGPLTTGYAFKMTSDAVTAQARGFGGFGVPTAATLASVTLGTARGLLVFAPPVAVVWVAWPWLVRRAPWETLAWSMPGLAFLTLHAARLTDWYGGLTWGPRYQCLGVPFWLLLLVHPRRPGWVPRALLPAALVGGAVSLLGAGVRWPHTLSAAWGHASFFGLQAKWVSVALLGDTSFHPAEAARVARWAVLGTGVVLGVLAAAVTWIWSLSRQQRRWVWCGVVGVVLGSCLALSRSYSRESRVFERLRREELLGFALALGGTENLVLASQLALDLGDRPRAAQLARQVLAEDADHELARWVEAVATGDGETLRVLAETGSRQIRQRARDALRRR